MRTLIHISHYGSFHFLFRYPNITPIYTPYNPWQNLMFSCCQTAEQPYGKKPACKSLAPNYASTARVLESCLDLDLYKLHFFQVIGPKLQPKHTMSGSGRGAEAHQWRRRVAQSTACAAVQGRCACFTLSRYRTFQRKGCHAHFLGLLLLCLLICVSQARRGMRRSHGCGRCIFGDAVSDILTGGQ